MISNVIKKNILPKNRELIILGLGVISTYHSLNLDIRDPYAIDEVYIVANKTKEMAMIYNNFYSLWIDYFYQTPFTPYDIRNKDTAITYLFDAIRKIHRDLCCLIHTLGIIDLDILKQMPKINPLESITYNE